MRNLRGRIALGVVAMWCGVGGGIAAFYLTDWLTRHCPRGQGGCGTGQAGWFALASIVFGGLLCGAAGGIVYEWLRRRADRIVIPRAIGRLRR